MDFAAPNPKENATLAQAHDLVKQYAAAGLAGQIFANPESAGASPLGGLVAEANFAKNGVPTSTDVPLYLSLQFPKSQYPDNYNVGLILIALKSGKSLTGALA